MSNALHFNHSRSHHRGGPVPITQRVRVEWRVERERRGQREGDTERAKERDVEREMQ